MDDFASTRLVTDRLRIASARLEDAAALATYYGKNRAHLAPWEPTRAPEAVTEEYWRRRLAQYDEDHRRGAALHLLMRRSETPTGPVVGTIDLSQIARGPFQACYLGFGLDEEMVGQSLMFEALRVTLNFAFSQVALHRIMANHLPENLRSGRLLRRLGFAAEGYARDYLFINGEWRDHVLTAFTNPNPTLPH